MKTENELLPLMLVLASDLVLMVLFIFLGSGILGVFFMPLITFTGVVLTIGGISILPSFFSFFEKSRAEQKRKSEILDREIAQVVADRKEFQAKSSAELITLSEKRRQQAEKKQQLTGKEQQLAEKKQQLAKEKQQLAGREQQLAGREQQLAGREQQLAGREQQLAGREQQLAGREQQLDDMEQHLVIDQRRMTLLMDNRAPVELSKLVKKVEQFKVVHGEVTPEEWKSCMKGFFEALKEEDGPLLQTMFTSPFSLTRNPKPIKCPENKIHDLLAQKVDDGLLTEEELDEITCPISKQVMQDPVTGEDGRTYDSFCLVNIYCTLPGTYPFDRREMLINPLELPRDEVMYKKIQALVKAHQLSSTSETDKEVIKSCSTALSVH